MPSAAKRYVRVAEPFEIDLERFREQVSIQVRRMPLQPYQGACERGSDRLLERHHGDALQGERAPGVLRCGRPVVRRHVREPPSPG